MDCEGLLCCKQTMSTSSIPLRCQDPEGCARWAAERAQVMAARLSPAERLHEAFLQRLAAQPPTSAWDIRLHGHSRQVFRAVGRAEVEEILLCGRPIEAAWVPQGGTILLLGETAAGRPLHLACQFLSPRNQALWVWKIATVYDPRSEAFRWSSDWSQRLCRCHPHRLSIRQDAEGGTIEDKE